MQIVYNFDFPTDGNVTPETREHIKVVEQCLALNRIIEDCQAKLRELEPKADKAALAYVKLRQGNDFVQKMVEDKEKRDKLLDEQMKMTMRILDKSGEILDDTRG